jgi:hypothetical protein
MLNPRLTTIPNPTEYRDPIAELALLIVQAHHDLEGAPAESVP